MKTIKRRPSIQLHRAFILRELENVEMLICDCVRLEKN